MLPKRRNERDQPPRTPNHVVYHVFYHVSMPRRHCTARSRRVRVLTTGQSVSFAFH